MNPSPKKEERRCDVCGGAPVHQGVGSLGFCDQCMWVVEGGDWIDQLIATLVRHPRLIDRLATYPERFGMVHRRLREQGHLDRYAGLSDREAVGLWLTTRPQIDR